MSILDTIIIAIVEGLTEFLPVSSTGHMIITQNLLGVESTEFVKAFTFIIQFGAILSVVVVSSFSKETQLSPIKARDALVGGARGTISVAIACAVAGNMATLITNTGIGQEIIRLGALKYLINYHI